MSELCDNHRAMCDSCGLMWVRQTAHDIEPIATACPNCGKTLAAYRVAVEQDCILPPGWHLATAIAPNAPMPELPPFQDYPIFPPDEPE